MKLCLLFAICNKNHVFFKKALKGIFWIFFIPFFPSQLIALREDFISTQIPLFFFLQNLISLHGEKQ